MSDAVVGVGNYDNHNTASPSTSTSSGGNPVEYLVGCRWKNLMLLPHHGSKDATSSVSLALYVIAGNSNGDGYVYRVDANQITPLVHLRGGHRGCIRDFCWSNDGRSMISTFASKGSGCHGYRYCLSTIDLSADF